MINERAIQLDKKLITKQALEHDDNLINHHKLIRLHRWSQAAILHELHQEVAEGIYLYQLTQGRPQTWTEYLDDPRRPSRTSAFKYMKLHRFYVLAHNVSTSTLSDISMERLFACMDYVDDDLEWWLTQAEILSDRDWEKMIYQQKYADENPVDNDVQTPERQVFFEDASAFPEIAEKYPRGTVLRFTVEPVTRSTASTASETEDILVTVLKTLKSLIQAIESGEDPDFTQAKKLLGAFNELA